MDLDLACTLGEPLVSGRIEECLTCLVSPEGHRRRIRTTNGIERLEQETKRSRTRVVGILPQPRGMCALGDRLGGRVRPRSCLCLRRAQSRAVGPTRQGSTCNALISGGFLARPTRAPSSRTVQLERENQNKTTKLVTLPSMRIMLCPLSSQASLFRSCSRASARGPTAGPRARRGFPLNSLASFLISDGV